MIDTSQSQAGGAGEKVYAREVYLPPFPGIGPDYLPESVHTHFHLTPHADAEHFNEAAELLKTADIFIPELAGWTPEAEAKFNRVTKGDSKVLNKLIQHQRNARFDKYSEAMLRALLGTYKPVLFIDVDISQRELIIVDEERAYKRVSTPEPEETLEGLADVTAKVAEASYARDIVMAKRLGPKVTRLVAEHPKLAVSDNVRVLVVLGYAHDSLYKAMSQAESTASKTSRSHWADTNELNIESRVIFKYRNGDAVTHADLAELLISLALDITTLPKFHPDPLFRFGRHYSRTPHELTQTGDRLVQIMLESGEEGLALANRLYRNTFSTSDGLQLMEMAVAAHKAVTLS